MVAVTHRTARQMVYPPRTRTRQARPLRGRTTKRALLKAKAHLISLGLSSCPYSPKCVELEFSEVHIQDPAYTRPDTPRITPQDTPHSPALLELVTPMDRYARLRMLLCRKQMSASAIISEGRSDPSHTLLRKSEWGKAKDRS